MMKYSEQLLCCSYGTPLIIKAMNQLIVEGYDYYYSSPKKSSGLGTLGKAGLLGAGALGLSAVINPEGTAENLKTAGNWIGNKASNFGHSVQDLYHNFSQPGNGAAAPTGTTTPQVQTASTTQTVVPQQTTQSNAPAPQQPVQNTGTTPQNNSNISHNANGNPATPTTDAHIKSYWEKNPGNAARAGLTRKDPFEASNANYTAPAQTQSSPQPATPSKPSNIKIGLGQTNYNSQYGGVNPTPTAPSLNSPYAQNVNSAVSKVNFFDRGNVGGSGSNSSSLPKPSLGRSNIPNNSTGGIKV